MVKSRFARFFLLLKLEREFLSLVERLQLCCPERVDGNGMPALKIAGAVGWVTDRKMNR